ncbi:MAG: tryptophan synthase subunit alpha [Syntrophomonadaceae bacterium]|nr:tryptophan synthase subunit alpha [Syntrophomonadaceae bacterium]
MSRVQQAFSRGKAFIPFITAGDPSLETTERLVIEMAAAGADLIEIGIPFSDPVAEGPIIQQADERALTAGTTTDGIFDMVGRIRQVCDVPLAFMTYMNPVFTYGTERFMQKCQDAGVDAVIVPDLPFEEKDELLPVCSRYGIDLISLIAPTSHERISMIASEAQGFIYCVSSMGVTGVREEINTQVGEMVKQVKAVRDIPCAVGFGISTPEQAAQIARFCDGVIVGSAIVKIVEQYGVNCVPPVIDFVRKMRLVMDQI